MIERMMERTDTARIGFYELYYQYWIKIKKKHF